MFSELDAALKHMGDFSGSCWIAGGWAIDLHLGRKTREHKDVEFTIARSEQKALLRLPGLARVEFIRERAAKTWDATWLDLPVHELYCHFASGYKLEILLNEFSDTEWFYRRDKRVSMPMRNFPRYPGAPLPIEIVLLYKARHRRAIDEMDFHAALPSLGRQQKAWLKQALMLDSPTHPWLEHMK